MSVSRVAPDLDLSDILPTELQRRSKQKLSTTLLVSQVVINLWFAQQPRFEIGKSSTLTPNNFNRRVLIFSYHLITDERKTTLKELGLNVNSLALEAKALSTSQWPRRRSNLHWCSF